VIGQFGLTHQERRRCLSHSSLYWTSSLVELFRVFVFVFLFFCFFFFFFSPFSSFSFFFFSFQMEENLNAPARKESVQQGVDVLSERWQQRKLLRADIAGKRHVPARRVRKSGDGVQVGTLVIGEYAIIFLDDAKVPDIVSSHPLAFIDTYRKVHAPKKTRKRGKVFFLTRNSGGGNQAVLLFEEGAFWQGAHSDGVFVRAGIGAGSGQASCCARSRCAGQHQVGGTQQQCRFDAARRGSARNLLALPKHHQH
jgi:hypothetical protein